MDFKFVADNYLFIVMICLGLYWTRAWVRMIREGVAYIYPRIRSREIRYPSKSHLNRSLSPALFWILIICTHILPATFLLVYPILKIVSRD